MVRVNRVRRIIRKVDPWTVLKVSFVFNFIISLTIVLGFSILWVLLVNAGVPQGLEEIARRLALLDDNASLVGNVEVLFSSVLFFATVYLLTQTAITTLGAFFYNLISDLVGGIEIIVLEESYSDQSQKPHEKNKNSANTETAAMSFSKTIGKFRKVKDTEESFATPEMPRPDVPRDIEEETLTETFKNYPKDDT
ncbi:MAG: DUF3566 domain-containing protein [Candidatus Actinomarina sp.]|tara:strand:- start:163 stop:747 length:585 start_codon:yes stop_codon:yes gene_type:complete